MDSGGAAGLTRNAVVPVEIAVAERKPMSVTKSYAGTLEGEDQANIVPKISERITGIGVHVGDRILKGTIVIDLDKSGASSQFYQAQAGYRNAEKTLERMKSLYAEGAISLQALDETQTAYEVSKANFEAARGAVELTSPISGVVTALSANLGELATPGAALATVARVDRMKVIFNVSEEDAAKLAVGREVRIATESAGETDPAGKIVQMSKSADVRSRSFEVRAVFANTRGPGFKPGMFCRAVVRLSGASDALVVPNAAIQSDGASQRVFVVSKGRAYLRQVRTGMTDGTCSEILEGINDLDTVVTTGATSVSDSSAVAVNGQPGQSRVPE